MTNNSTLFQNSLKKMITNCTVIFILFFLIICQVQSQTVNPELLKHRWKASWISGNNASLKAYGVYLYRKSVSIAEQPKTFIIHISADNKYKLYINETLVSLGPAVADLYHWKFETVDVAKYLNKGINIVTALVSAYSALARSLSFSELTRNRYTERPRSLPFNTTRLS